MAFTRTLALSVLGMAASSLALADCTDIIALSKTTSDVVQTKQSLDSHARAFCSEYKSQTSSAKSASYGASYKLLSASMAKGSSSEAEVASRYCSADQGSSAREDAFRQYAESISPSAYQAYEACIKFSKAAILFDVNAASMLPTEISIGASYRPDNSSTARLRYSASKDVKCQWAGVAGANVATLNTGTSTVLECSRDKQTQRSFVVINDENSGSGNRITIEWPAYSDAGVPLNLVADLQKKVEESSARLEAATRSLQGAVVAFSASQCPAGWQEYQAAYGRFIRGIDKSGSAVDPDGVRAAGARQEDLLREHSHSFEKMTGVIHGMGARTHMGNSAPVYVAGATGRAGGAETRPKNVALLYCIRQ